MWGLTRTSWVLLGGLAGCIAGCIAERAPRCEEIKAADGGRWALQDEAVLARPEGADVATGIDDLRLHDLDEDGRADLILNHRGARNRLFVARAGYCGTYEPFREVVLEGPLSEDDDWASADLLVADVDGAGAPELVWNVRTISESVVYVGRLDPADPGRASVRGGLPLELGPTDWRQLNPYVADLDHDGLDDVFWTRSDNDLCAGVAYGDPSAQLIVRGPLQCWPLEDFLGLLEDPPHDLAEYWDLPVRTRTLVGDRDADGQPEVWWNAYRTSPNALLLVAHDPTADALRPVAASVRREWPSWGDFAGLVGNVDAAHGDDAVWVRGTFEDARIYQTLTTEDGRLEADATRGSLAGGPRAVVFVGPLDHVPGDDLVHLRPDGVTWVVTVQAGAADRGLVGTVDQEDEEDEEDEEAPAPPAVRLPVEATLPHLADADGDGLEDLVFLETRSASVRVRVALSTPGGAP